MSRPATAPSAGAPPRALVLAVVGAPVLGTAAALALAWRNGGVQAATLWVFAAFYLLSAIGVEIGFHRYFSHRSFKCSVLFRYFLGAAGSIAGQGPVLYWVCVHREHHRFADTEHDPHTPVPLSLRNFLRAHVGWLFAARPLNVAHALPDLMNDPTTLDIQRRYMLFFALGLAAPAGIGGALGGLRGAEEGLLWGGLVRVFVNHQVTWSVNSVCHLVGSRPFSTGDHSRNVWLLALPSLGGSWHNNHHAWPLFATNDRHWWQIDPGAWIIRLARLAGFVWDVRQPRRGVKPERFS